MDSNPSWFREIQIDSIEVGLAALAKPDAIFFGHDSIPLDLHGYQ